jgi:hypothetical protein
MSVMLTIESTVQHIHKEFLHSDAKKHMCHSIVA